MQLVTAQRGDGVPARWVHTCSCPPGHEGEFCQRCAPGFKRRDPADGAFSPCEPCSCRGGSCDPQTGDCYSADETPADRSCSQGFYRDPRRPETCVRCPCADGVSCSLAPGSLEPRCERCPSGTSGETKHTRTHAHACFFLCTCCISLGLFCVSESKVFFFQILDHFGCETTYNFNNMMFS